MSIEVRCLQGHLLHVKDKYAGKSGLCPHCHSRVNVPFVLGPDDVLEIVGQWVPPTAKSVVVSDDDDDDANVLSPPSGDKGSGVSLIGSSIIHHNKSCPQCQALMPHWFATCSACGLAFHDFEVGQAR